MKWFHFGTTLVLALVFASLIWYAVGFNSYVEHMTAPPLGLSKNYLDLTVFNIPLIPGTYEQKVEFMAGFHALIENKEVTIIATTGSMATGLYDSKGTYDSCPLVSGHPLAPQEFQQNNLLINADSFTYTTIGSDMTYQWGDTRFEVVGIYSNLHPLSEIHAEFICNLFHPQYIRNSELSGRYRIDVADKELSDAIIAYFEDAGSYFTLNTSNKSMWALLKEYLLGTEYYYGNLRFIWLTLITYFSCFTLLYNMLCTQKKFAATSLHFGATRIDLFFALAKKGLLNLCLGTISGLGIFFLIYGKVAFSAQVVLVAALVNLVLISFIFALAFSLVRFEIKEGEAA